MTNHKPSPAIELLLDGFSRIHDGVAQVLNGLSAADLAWRPGPNANPIGWLIWHLCRIEDLQMSGVAEALGRAGVKGQLWTDGGFAAKFKLPYSEEACGYGQSSAEVGEFHASAALLKEYAEAVSTQTRNILNTLHDDDFAIVVDKNWTPPVTAGVRVVSTLMDDAQHLGQAEYLKGLQAKA